MYMSPFFDNRKVHSNLYLRIIRDLNMQVYNLVENDVLNIMEGYSYINSFSNDHRLFFSKFTSLVAELADKNQDLVNKNFLIKYLSKYTQVRRQMQR